VILVENLTKYYGTTIGIENLNFQVQKGEVLGFLGPNGAGKTTTLKILTCYLPPTAGTAKIFGYDILENPLEVRKKIGYLPEKTPLYTDMIVQEYLEFVGSLKGIPANRLKEDVSRVIEQCGLTDVYRRTIGKLSKGYQQRVGIAQAILSDPELLILDEPTIGLDPKQIIEIRELIKNLGKERTVILSSHILPEVSQVCNRIIVINRGKLVAVDTPENLRNRLRKSSVVIVKVRKSDEPGKISTLIKEIDGVLMVSEREASDSTQTFSIESSPQRDIRADIAKQLVTNGIDLLEIHVEELSLEDIFLKLVTDEEVS